MAQWVEPLPSAQVVVSGSWDRAPHRALCSEGTLLPPVSLPASLPTCDLCQINKILKKKKNHPIRVGKEGAGVDGPDVSLRGGGSC